MGNYIDVELLREQLNELAKITQKHPILEGIEELLSDLLFKLTKFETVTLEAYKPRYAGAYKKP